MANKKIYLCNLILMLLMTVPRLAFAKVEPNDPGYYAQWYLDKTKIPEAWEITTGTPDIIIAFLDSGVDIDHPDLNRSIWVNIDEIDGDNIDNDRNGYVDDAHGWDFVNQIKDPNPTIDESYIKNGVIDMSKYTIINHGTLMAGVAAAKGNNSEGITGVAWAAKIMPLKIDEVSTRANEKILADAVNYAVNNGADIINLSFEVDYGNEEFRNALINAYNKGVIIVASAGNDDQYPKYPVCFTGQNGENIILGVAGTDKNDNLIEGYATRCADLAAPATDYFSTSVYAPVYEEFKNYYTGYWPGTSFASSLVSGIAALLKSAKPALNNKEIYNLLINSTDDVQGNYSFGRINAAKALGIEEEINEVIELYILAAPQSAAGPEIRKFSRNGFFVNSFLSFEENYTGGLNIASSDIDQDGNDEIIAAKASGDMPQVRIFDIAGNLKSEFLAYDIKFRGGVNIGTGDINGDGVDEIITGAGQGGGPHVRVFDGNGNVKKQFFAYDKNFRGGVYVAAGDVDGDGVDEIITGAGQGGGPHVRVFDMAGNLLSQFFSGSINARGGINISAGDIDQDGVEEIITGAGFNDESSINIFNSQGIKKLGFFGYNDSKRGINVSVINIRSKK